MKRLIPLIALACCFSSGLFAQELAGNWTMQVPGPEEGTMVDLLLTMMDDGTFHVDFGIDGAVEIKGAYELDGDQITIWETEAVEGMGCGPTKGVYSYTVSETTLDLARISDDCEDPWRPRRHAVYT